MTVEAPKGMTVEVNGLTKRFGSVLAVDNIAFTVHPGRVTGFLGPNGSGKTTTLRMLLGLVRPTSGSATVNGQRYHDIPNPAQQVGAVLEATSFHPSRRARSHLRMVALAAGIDQSRVDVVLDQVGLTGDAKRKVGGFSLGMRQRLELATALLGNPGLLILDEPSNGLDPQGIVWLREFMRHLASEGRTVLVSSHLLSEMAQTIDDVIIVSQGKLRAQGPLSTLADQAKSSMKIVTPEADRTMAVLAATGFNPVRSALDTVTVDVSPPQLGPVLAANQLVVYELIHQRADLESLFMSLTTGLGYGDIPNPNQPPPPAMGTALPPQGTPPPSNWGAPPPGPFQGGPTA